MSDSGVDLAATAQGGAVGVAIALPAALVQGAAGPDATITPFMLPVIFGAFVLGGYVATARSEHGRLATAAVAGMMGFAAVQLVWLASRGGSLTSASLVAIAFRFMLTASCGVLGGWIHQAVAARRSTAP